MTVISPYWIIFLIALISTLILSLSLATYLSIRRARLAAKRKKLAEQDMRALANDLRGGRQLVADSIAGLRAAERDFGIERDLERGVVGSGERPPAYEMGRVGGGRERGETEEKNRETSLEMRKDAQEDEWVTIGLDDRK